jgi:hypothetical protein
LCGEGNIFGGKTPAQTWFEAMTPIMAPLPVVGLPAGDPRYMNGGEGTRVPNVIGRSQQEATQILQQAGFQVIARPRNDVAPKGTVVGQTRTALPGSAVTINVSTGIAPSPSTPPGPGPGQPGTGGGGPGNGGGGGGGRGGFPEPIIIFPTRR